jgi:chromosome segregation ATPase
VHILTKIFVVLTSLLSVALVPLVMLNTASDDTFKRRWSDEQARAVSAVAAKDIAQRLQETEVRSFQDLAKDLEIKLAKAQIERDAAIADAALVNGLVASNKAQLDRLASNLQVFAESDKIKSELVANVSKELVTLRTGLTKAERDNVQLDDQVANLTSESEVVKAQLRQTQEQLKQATDDRDKTAADAKNAADQLKKYATYAGALPQARPGATSGANGETKIPADRSLSATIINVRRGADSTLAEINAGSRDGVQPGWVMSIADGGKYVGNLRITTVDVNRSVGVVELEQAGKGEVRTGLRVIARKGE